MPNYSTSGQVSLTEREKRLRLAPRELPRSGIPRASLQLDANYGQGSTLDGKTQDMVTTMLQHVPVRAAVTPSTPREFASTVVGLTHLSTAWHMERRKEDDAAARALMAGGMRFGEVSSMSSAMSKRRAVAKYQAKTAGKSLRGTTELLTQSSGPLQGKKANLNSFNRRQVRIASVALREHIERQVDILKDARAHRPFPRHHNLYEDLFVTCQFEHGVWTSFMDIQKPFLVGKPAVIRELRQICAGYVRQFGAEEQRKTMEELKEIRCEPAPVDGFETARQVGQRTAAYRHALGECAARKMADAQYMSRDQVSAVHRMIDELCRKERLAQFKSRSSAKGGHSKTV